MSLRFGFIEFWHFFESNINEIYLKKEILINLFFSKLNKDEIVYKYRGPL